MSHFKVVTDNERQQILDDWRPQNTKKATKLWLDCFRDYLVEKKMNLN